MKDAQDTVEDFSPQKRTISTLKHKMLPFSYFLSVIFSLLDTMRIHANPDLDPHYWFQVYVIMIFLFIGLAYKPSTPAIVDTKSCLSIWYGESATLRINDARSLRRLQQLYTDLCPTKLYKKLKYRSYWHVTQNLIYHFLQDIQAKNRAPV